MIKVTKLLFLAKTELFIASCQFMIKMSSSALRLLFTEFKTARFVKDRLLLKLLIYVIIRLIILTEAIWQNLYQTLSVCHKIWTKYMVHFPESLVKLLRASAKHCFSSFSRQNVYKKLRHFPFQQFLRLALNKAVHSFLDEIKSVWTK